MVYVTDSMALVGSWCYSYDAEAARMPVMWIQHHTPGLHPTKHKLMLKQGWSQQYITIYVCLEINALLTKHTSFVVLIFVLAEYYTFVIWGIWRTRTNILSSNNLYSCVLVDLSKFWKKNPTITYLLSLLDIALTFLSSLIYLFFSIKHVWY